MTQESQGQTKHIRSKINKKVLLQLRVVGLPILTEHLHNQFAADKERHFVCE